MQLFARLGAGNLGTFGIGVFLEDEVSHGSLVELCGEDGTGMSTLLHHMAVQCVLPKLVPGGAGGEVVFVTTNCGVNMHMMVSMLTKRLQCLHQLQGTFIGGGAALWWARFFHVLFTCIKIKKCYIQTSYAYRDLSACDLARGLA